MTAAKPPMNPLDLVAHGPVIPVIVLQREQDAVPLAEALLAGGVRVLEVTLRTPVALRCIEAIARALPDALRRCRHAAQRGRCRVGARRRRALRRQPRLGRTDLGHACRNLGLPLLPAWPRPAR
jgi:2-dehydro-3-deoxyphosphogluconate aldolase/(4S)-4-hydroxy-2-oxoglutarate aldolase